MPFLPPNQQRQSTEGNNNNNIARETSYLFQRISIMLQRFNSVLLHNTLPVDLPDLWPSDILILAFVVFNPGDLYYLGYKKNNNNMQHLTYHVSPDKTMNCRLLFVITVNPNFGGMLFAHVQSCYTGFHPNSSCKAIDRDWIIDSYWLIRNNL